MLIYKWDKNGSVKTSRTERIYSQTIPVIFSTLRVVTTFNLKQGKLIASEVVERPPDLNFGHEDRDITVTVICESNWSKNHVQIFVWAQRQRVKPQVRYPPNYAILNLSII